MLTKDQDVSAVVITIDKEITYLKYNSKVASSCNSTHFIAYKYGTHVLNYAHCHMWNNLNMEACIRIYNNQYRAEQNPKVTSYFMLKARFEKQEPSKMAVIWPACRLEKPIGNSLLIGQIEYCSSLFMTALKSCTFLFFMYLYLYIKYNLLAYIYVVNQLKFHAQ